jgi:hypothetical protein
MRFAKWKLACVHTVHIVRGHESDQRVVNVPCLDVNLPGVAFAAAAPATCAISWKARSCARRSGKRIKVGPR